MPKIAAIVPVFNRPRSIVACLHCILAQSRPADRVIVVDDGSSDETPEAVEAFFRQHPSFPGTLIRQDNAGPAAARNRAAAEAADCDVLAWLDSDDEWPEDYLHRVELAFHRMPDAIAVSSDYVRIHIDSDGTNREQRMDVSWVEHDTTTRFCSEAYHVPNPSSTAVKREAFESIGGFEPTTIYCEDWQAMLRLSLIGRFVHSAGEPVRFIVAGQPDPSEAKHMSELHPYRSWFKAYVYERFILSDGGERMVPRRIWGPRLGRLWYRAGRKYLRLGDPGRARACFHRCLRHRPLHLKARWWGLKTLGHLPIFEPAVVQARQSTQG